MGTKIIKSAFYVNLLLFSIIGYTQSVNDKLKYIKHHGLFIQKIFIPNGNGRLCKTM